MLRRLSVLLCALLLAATASVAVAPVAAAQEDEVFVDPGSPSGKEYELPIDRAREQAGTSTKKRSGSQKAPLFGEGVEGGAAGTSGQRQSGDTRAGGRDKRSTDTARKASKRARQRAAAEREAQVAARSEAAEERAAEERAAELARMRALRAQAAAPGGGSGLAVIIAAGIAIVLIGGLVGLWLRRRATR